MNAKTILCVLFAASLLAACGGSDAPAPPPVAASDAVPDSASQSAQGMVTWMAALAKEDTEAKAPLDTAGFRPPALDSAEPLALP